MNEGADEQLSPKQQEAIIALLNEGSITKAAAKIDVNEKTLRRWLDEPEFSAAYRRSRRNAYGQAIGLVQRYAATAVNVIARVMTDSAAPAHARISAASAMLKFGREGIELDDLAARVETLEQAAKRQQDQAKSGYKPCA